MSLVESWRLHSKSPLSGPVLGEFDFFGFDIQLDIIRGQAPLGCFAAVAADAHVERVAVGAVGVCGHFDCCVVHELIILIQIKTARTILVETPNNPAIYPPHP